jgi:hypothetical protein
MQFESEDRVRVNGQNEIWTVKGYHEGSDKYQVQLGLDAATLMYVAGDDLELVERPKRADDGPRFVPSRGIME